jgi:hypothetical protein
VDLLSHPEYNLTRKSDFAQWQAMEHCRTFPVPPGPIGDFIIDSALFGRGFNHERNDHIMDSRAEYFGIYVNGLPSLTVSITTLPVISLIIVLTAFTKCVGQRWTIHPTNGP